MVRAARERCKMGGVCNEDPITCSCSINKTCCIADHVKVSAVWVFDLLGGDFGDFPMVVSTGGLQNVWDRIATMTRLPRASVRLKGAILHVSRGMFYDEGATGNVVQGNQGFMMTHETPPGTSSLRLHVCDFEVGQSP